MRNHLLSVLAMTSLAYASPSCPAFGLGNASHGTASTEVIRGYVHAKKMALQDQSDKVLDSNILLNWEKISENGKCGFVFRSSKDPKQEFKAFF